MTDKSRTTHKSVGWIIVYVLVVMSALGFDFLTDRAFGAIMLAVLPISLIAWVCLVVGPGLKGEENSSAFKGWFVGAILILIISIAFSLLGAAQAHTGELVFTYATMIMALPTSLVLPLAANWLESLLGGSNVTLRIVGMWTVCVIAGWIEWKTLGWLYACIRRYMRKRKSTKQSKI